MISQWWNLDVLKIPINKRCLPKTWCDSLSKLKKTIITFKCIHHWCHFNVIKQSAPWHFCIIYSTCSSIWQSDYLICHSSLAPPFYIVQLKYCIFFSFTWTSYWIKLRHRKAFYYFDIKFYFLEYVSLFPSPLLLLRTLWAFTYAQSSFTTLV